MFFRKFNSFVAALLVVALLIGSVSFALAADYPFAATLKTSGTLRKAASESSVVLAVLPAGDAVYVTGESGNYYIVEYDGASGYLLKNAVNSSAPSANQPTEAQAARYATLAQGSEGQLVRDLQSALIELGYLSDTTCVFKGYVAGLGVEFRDIPMLVVKLMDVRKLMMSGGVKRQLYDDKNYSDVFKKIMSNYSKLCSVVCDATSDELTSPVSQSTNDFDFVNRELIGKGKSDREFFVVTDKAYFRERGKNKTPIMKAELGRLLLKFSMMAEYLDTEINVVGYDPANIKSLTSNIKAKTSENYSPVITPTPKQYFIDADADNESKTKVRAEAIAKRMQMKACFAEGELVGLPEIIPGRYIEIKDLDSIADRKYYISEVRHCINESRFSTFFETRGWI